MATERRTIVFTGRVQGVGFRYTAIQAARDLPLGGTVRNLPDGGVELVVEGRSKDIEELLSRLREHFGSFIRNVQQTSSAPQGETDGIRVTY